MFAGKFLGFDCSRKVSLLSSQAFSGRGAITSDSPLCEQSAGSATINFPQFKENLITTTILPSFRGEGDDGAGGEENKVVSFTNKETPNLALQAWFLEELVL